VLRELQSRDVRGYFHRDSDDFGFGLGPGHGEILRLKVNSKRELGFFTQSGERNPDDALHSARAVPGVTDLRTMSLKALQ
jgi:hypothetical protein